MSFLRCKLKFTNLLPGVYIRQFSYSVQLTLFICPFIYICPLPLFLFVCLCACACVHTYIYRQVNRTGFLHVCTVYTHVFPTSLFLLGHLIPPPSFPKGGMKGVKFLPTFPRIAFSLFLLLISLRHLSFLFH